MSYPLDTTGRPFDQPWRGLVGWWRGYALGCLAVGWWAEVGCRGGSRESAGGSAGAARGSGAGIRALLLRVRDARGLLRGVCLKWTGRALKQNSLVSNCTDKCLSQSAGPGNGGVETILDKYTGLALGINMSAPAG